MVFKLGSNVLSVTVQRNLSRSTEDLSTTSERLASGQRINKASDDAAGLAICMSLNIDSRVLTQGVRNLNDGLSAVSIADAAINELTSITQRIEELAVQSMNGTFSDTQRSSMQREVTALQAEWNRTVESTTFNGLNLLTGSSTGMVLQAGKGTEGTLAVQIGQGGIGGTTRVNTDSAGNQANLGTGTSYVRGISADGRFVAFDSGATNLIAGDTNGRRDVFIKDTLTGMTTRVSTDSAGNQANDGSYVQSISSDGRFVIFSSSATNLVAGDTNGVLDAFMKDTVTGVTVRISTDSAGNQGNDYSEARAISADGRFVAFESRATNLVAGDTTGGARDVFIKDTQTGVTTRVNTDSAGNEGLGDTRAYGISADGRFVLFNSWADNYVAGDTNIVMDAFVKDTLTGKTTRASTNSAGEQSNTDGSWGRAFSADGRFVAFHSWGATFVNGDTNSAVDVFLKDTLTGTTTRVSTDSAGNEGNGYSFARAISADGRFVVFESVATNLVSGDTNGRSDIFVKDTATGVTTRISTNTAGTQGNNNSYGGTISADGRFAAFWSDATNLVAGDTNTTRDSFLKDLTKLGVQTMAGMVVSNRASAAVTLGLVQRYRNELLQYRSNIGASTQRIQSFVSNLGVAAENFRSAESRIVDTDIASEAAESLRLQILRQSATSLLRQANLAPQIALDLLRNA